MEIGEYLDKLPEEVKPDKMDNPVSAAKFISKEETSPAEAPPKVKSRKIQRKRSVKRNQPALPADIECGLRNDKARALLDELQSILPERAPIGTALLLRSLLEVSLIARMKKVGTWGDFMAKHAPPESKGFIPGLEKILKFAVSSERTIPDEGLRRAVGEPRTVPKEFLNLVAHNDQHILVATDVRDIVARLTPLIRELLK